MKVVKVVFAEIVIAGKDLIIMKINVNVFYLLLLKIVLVFVLIHS